MGNVWPCKLLLAVKIQYAVFSNCPSMSTYLNAAALAETECSVGCRNHISSHQHSYCILVVYIYKKNKNKLDQRSPHAAMVSFCCSTFTNQSVRMLHPRLTADGDGLWREEAGSLTSPTLTLGADGGRLEQWLSTSLWTFCFQSSGLQ